MAKFHGLIGYTELVETTPGVWEEQIVEKDASGDILTNTRGLQTTDQVNDNVNISNKISIVANPYAAKNFHSIRYVVFMGAKWKIKDVDVQYPRLILSIGGLYNGN